MIAIMSTFASVFFFSECLHSTFEQ